MEKSWRYMYKSESRMKNLGSHFQYVPSWLCSSCSPHLAHVSPRGHSLTFPHDLPVVSPPCLFLVVPLRLTMVFPQPLPPDFSGGTFWVSWIAWIPCFGVSSAATFGVFEDSSRLPGVWVRRPSGLSVRYGGGARSKRVFP